MSKMKIFYTIITLLVVMNAILLIFIVSSPRHGMGIMPERHHNKRSITEIFDLDDHQFIAFEKSKNEHAKVIRDLNKNIAETSKSFYLSQNPDERDSLLNVITLFNTQFYTANIQHIDDLRTIIPADKAMELERFIHGLTTRRNARPGKPKRPIH